MQYTYLIEQNLDKLSWYMLSKNPNAIHLLGQNQNKICWHWLALNPNDIQLLNS